MSENFLYCVISFGKNVCWMLKNAGKLQYIGFLSTTTPALRGACTTVHVTCLFACIKLTEKKNMHAGSIKLLMYIINYMH